MSPWKASLRISSLISCHPWSFKTFRGHRGTCPISPLLVTILGTRAMGCTNRTQEYLILQTNGLASQSSLHSWYKSLTPFRNQLRTHQFRVWCLVVDTNLQGDIRHLSSLVCGDSRAWWAPDMDNEALFTTDFSGYQNSPTTGTVIWKGYCCKMGRHSHRLVWVFRSLPQECTRR